MSSLHAGVINTQIGQGHVFLGSFKLSLPVKSSLNLCGLFVFTVFAVHKNCFHVLNNVNQSFVDIFCKFF